MNPEKPTTVGQVVQLKSGGPAMTIVAIKGEHADLVWFSAAGVQSAAYVCLSALVVVDDTAARKAWPDHPSCSA